MLLILNITICCNFSAQTCNPITLWLLCFNPFFTCMHAYTINLQEESLSLFKNTQIQGHPFIQRCAYLWVHSKYTLCCLACLLGWVSELKILATDHEGSSAVLSSAPQTQMSFICSPLRYPHLISLPARGSRRRPGLSCDRLLLCFIWKSSVFVSVASTVTVVRLRSGPALVVYKSCIVVMN